MREKKREKVLKECVPREPVLGWGRASGMLPWRSQWRLGQGWKNASPESWEWRLAGAGLEECSPRAPLLLWSRSEGAPWGESSPRPPSGSRMAADQVSVWGSASCREGFGLPWGGDRRLKALLFLSKNTSQMLCLTALSVQSCIAAILHGERETVSVVWLLISVGTRHGHILDMRLQCQARKHGFRPNHRRNILLLTCVY